MVLPSRLAGTSYSGNVHLADWWATFSWIIGVNASDPDTRHTGGTAVPPIDSVSVWEHLMLRNTSQHARFEVPLDIAPSCRNTTGGFSSCALIQGDLKLVTGTQNLLGYWTGARHPNSSEHDRLNSGCPDGCLFDLSRDPEERTDLKQEREVDFKRMLLRLAELGADSFSSNSTSIYTNCLSTVEYASRYGGSVVLMALSVCVCVW